MRKQLTAIGLGFILPVVLAALWEMQSRQSAAHAFIFAPLGRIAATFGEMLADGSLLMQASASLERALTALAIGGSIGIVTGAALGSVPLFEKSASPIINAFRQVPIVGWMPLIAFWLGNGDGAKLLLVSLAAFYPTALNTQKGLHAADKRLLEVGTLYGFSRWNRLRLIAWPSALPLVFTGISQALAFCWIATIAVELLFDASAGLGTQMMLAEVAARSDVVIVCIVCVGLMGFALNHGFALVSRHALRWRPARA